MPATTHTRRCSAITAALALALSAGAGAAPFVYQGTLTDQGRPANGRYDLQLHLYRSAEGLDPVAAPVTVPGVKVANGVFRVEAEIDAVGSDATVFVSVGLRESGTTTGFSTLAVREKATLGSTAIGACWSSTGDAGSNPATNFLGTTDAQPLELRANNQRGFRLEASGASVNVVAGSSQNNIGAGVRGATIAGGGATPLGDPDFASVGANAVYDAYGTIGGGVANVAGSPQTANTSEPFATVAGGNTNGALAAYASIGGGSANSITRENSTIGGGVLNAIDGIGSTIAGGAQNTIDSNGNGGAVGGGYQNLLGAGYATIAGGRSHEALGAYAAVPGGDGNQANGDYSFAAGRRAIARDRAQTGEPLSCDDTGTCGDEGTFIWADSANADFVSTGPNQFLVRASGGMALNTSTIPASSDLVVKGRANNNADLYLQSGAGAIGYNFGVDGTDAATSDLFIARYDGSTFTNVAKVNANGTFQVFFNTPISPAGGAWAAASDARLKHDIAPLTGALDRLLALQGVTFEYNADVPAGYGLPGTRTGFVAQQVETVFPDWISYDAQGYRLVAPKGFEALTVEALREVQAGARREGEAQAARIATLERERDDQDARFAALADRLDALARDNAELQVRVRALSARDDVVLAVRR